MMKRSLIFLFLAILIAVVAFNFKRILVFGQANEIHQKAQSALTLQRWDKALTIYQAGAKQYPENSTIALKLAGLYRRVGQPARAELVYRNILKREPEHEEAAMALSDFLQRTPKRVNEAVVVLRQALKANPHEYRLLDHIGALYKTAAENPLEQRESTKHWLYQQARYYYQHSLRENPRQFQTRFNLGVALQNLNQLQPAADAYCQAITLVPDRYEPRYNLGVVLSEMDYFDEAYRQLDQAVKTLMVQGHTDQAQALALKVQIIKNRVYNSGKQGLTKQPIPPFLKGKPCLVQVMPVADEGSGSD